MNKYENPNLDDDDVRSDDGAPEPGLDDEDDDVGPDDGAPEPNLDDEDDDNDELPPRLFLPAAGHDVTDADPDKLNPSQEN